MSVMEITIDRSLIVGCGCGCGTPTNLRQLRAAALRATGMTVQEVADELDASQGTTSELLRQFRAREFPRFLRGHGRRQFDPTRDGPTPTMQAASGHKHIWRTEGKIRLIGAIPFRIDVCVAKGCHESRACRPSGPAGIPAPPLLRRRRKM